VGEPTLNDALDIPCRHHERDTHKRLRPALLLYHTVRGDPDGRHLAEQSMAQLGSVGGENPFCRLQAASWVRVNELSDTRT